MIPSIEDRKPRGIDHPHYHRDWARNNPEKRKATQARSFSGTMRAFLQQKAQELGCSHCGTRETGRLLWHHIDPATKNFKLSASPNWESMESEMKLCEPLCIKCHNRHHARVRREQLIADRRQYTESRRKFSCGN